MLNLKGYKVVLASKSPQRKQILDKVIKEYQIEPSNFPENVQNSNPREYVALTANGKVEEVYARLSKSCDNLLVISADTIITFENKIYEKPRDSQDAFNTLKELKGKTHIVMTAVCVKTSAHFLSFVEETKVTFGPISDQLIQDYVATGDPMDKAGSYGYQSLGGALVENINGCYYNVVGFPLFKFIQEMNAYIKE